MGVRLVVAEDSYLIREGIRLLLDSEPGLELAAAVPTLPELFAAVAEHDPDVVLTDIRMPPGAYDEGIEAAERLARSHPALGVVVLSQYVEAEFALRLFDGGARGRAYLLKERVGDLTQLRDAIDAVTRGQVVLDRLTPREQAVLELLAQGASNAAIAARLTLSDRAVEKHITAILTKLDLHAEDSSVHRRVRAVLLYLSETSG